MASLLFGLLILLYVPAVHRQPGPARPVRRAAGPRLRRLWLAFFSLWALAVEQLAIPALRLPAPMPPAAGAAPAAHVSLAAVPHRAYPLTCCLLD